MKAHMMAVARKLISPSLRYEIRTVSNVLRDMLGRACFWHWEVARFRLQQESPYEILYIGRKQQREMAKLLIGGKVQQQAPEPEGPAGSLPSRVVVSELPTLGALSVPHYLSAVVPLGRSLDDITARYDSELRRSIRKNRPLYQMRQTLSDDEIAMADRDLLRPYASARQGIHAAQFPTEEVFRLANGFDYYDIGLCLARPDDGLLKWKRRRGGDIDSLGNHAYMFIRLPKTGVARFLWDTPLFAVEGNKLTLHLGLPEGSSDEALASRYHEMVFGGLHKIYLYGAQSSGELFFENLRERYANLKSPPTMERVLSN